MMGKMLKSHCWYAGGLHFECTGCGNCCAGPDEGYIWVTPREIELLAEQLRLSVEAVRKKYIRRVGFRLSIIEHPATKDCIFLTPSKDGCRGCAIYPVRPNQCRTWPFWNENLASPDDWNRAAVKCPGINRGRLYSVEDIDRIRKQKSWCQEK
jgi:Fe-S-cluster containining protein